MFGKKAEETKQQLIATTGETSVLAEGTRIEGNITTTESIRLDGSVVGNVSCQKRLVLGEESAIVGDVKAESATIAGKIEGKIVVNGKLLIQKSGHIKGGIRAAEMSVEQGAHYEGNTNIG